MKLNEIRIRPSSITMLLGIIAFLLVIASVAGQLSTYLTGHNWAYGFIPLFDLDRELNIPSFFSMLLLLFAALILSVIAGLEKKRKGAPTSYWAALSFILLFMAFDEIVSIHEKLIDPVRDLLNVDSLGIFFYAWVIPGMVIVFIFTLVFLKFWLSLPAKTRNYFLIAAVFYVGGSIGMELVGGSYAEINGANNLVYNMMVTVEESLEMAGIILFIRGLLGYIAQDHKEISFIFDEVRR
jgi:hypothetical protein